MSIYFVPALISLLFKIFALAYVLRGAQVSIVFLSLIVVFALHNSIEILGYFQFVSGEAIGVFFRLYYVATVYVILYILLHGLSVSKLENTFKTTSLIIVSTGLSVLILFTDIIIAGQYSIGYSMTAVKGELYWLFAAYLFIILTCSSVALIYGYSRAKSKLDSVRCIHSLLALTPIIFVFVLATILKLTGASINATGLVPIATAIFLAIVLRTESKHKLSDLRRLMPLSSEREMTNNIMDLLDIYLNKSKQGITYKDLQEGLEREIIFYSLKKCDNNISHTSEMMGLKNRSTLYSMMNRLGIDMQKLKRETEERKTSTRAYSSRLLKQKSPKV